MYSISMAKLLTFGLALALYMSADNSFKYVCVCVCDRKFTPSAERNNAGSKTVDRCRMVCSCDIFVGCILNP